MKKEKNSDKDLINPALDKFKSLIGDWEMLGKHRLIPNPITGKCSFSWIDDGTFLAMNTDFNQSGPPNSTAIIGSDDKSGRYTMLYYDVRGVSRIYEIKFDDNVLEIQRDYPGFSQRFKGILNKAGNTIEGVWELCEDDINWKEDVEIVYTRI